MPLDSQAGTGLVERGLPDSSVDLRERSPGDAGKLVVEVRHRRDIDGLRAVAVTLVVLFHAGVVFLPGGFIGVDVFFVISGFLISGMLIREASERNTVSLRDFYARRVRRLLPASIVVLLAVIVMSWLILPPLTLATTGHDIQSAALFFSNWNFASQASDYWASGVDKSPVLHFWSLSVEEQFYFIWPLLLLAFVCRRRFAGNSRRAKRIAAVLVATVFVGSLAWSVLRTAENPTWSYFGLHTRAWELAAGAGVALAAAKLAPLTMRSARIVTWIGLIGIVASAMVLTSQTVYPGYAALLPVMSTVLILIGGSSRYARGGQSRLLSSRPFQYIGSISYSWYLWHWPLLVFAGVLFATNSAADVPGSPVGGVAPGVVACTVLVSLVAAALSKHFVEDPARRSKWLRKRPKVSLLAGVALTAVVVVAAAQLTQQTTSVPSTSTEQVTKAAGAINVSPAVIPAGQKLTLKDSPLAAKTTKGDLPPGCAITGPEMPDLTACNIGDPNGTKTVVFAGDSQAQAWSTGMGEAAKSLHWKMYTVARPACPVMKLDRSVWDREGCADYQDWLMKAIRTLPSVDMVLLARSRIYLQDDQQPKQADWQQASSETFKDLGPLFAKTVVLRDVPIGAEDPFAPDCVSSTDNMADCDWDKTIGDADQTAAEVAAAKGLGGTIRHLNLSQLVCPTATCHAVDRFGTITYRDNLHISSRFSRSLWRVIKDRLEPLI